MVRSVDWGFVLEGYFREQEEKRKKAALLTIMSEISKSVDLNIHKPDHIEIELTFRRLPKYKGLPGLKVMKIKQEDGCKWRLTVGNDRLQKAFSTEEDLEHFIKELKGVIEHDRG